MERVLIRSVWMVAAAVLLAGLGGLLVAGSVYAATIHVNTTLPGVRDDGKCSLAEAILAANDNSGGTTNDCTPGDDSPVDTIVLVKTTYPLTGTFEASGDGLPPVQSRVVISGNGAIVTRQSAEAFRILEIGNLGDLTIFDTTLSKGKTAGDGGGIYNGNKLALYGSHLLANGASTTGGGVYSVDNSGTLIDSSTIVSNSSGGKGGGIFSSGSATVTTSSILSNTAENGAGAATSNNSTMIISHTDVLSNSASFDGGGLYGEFDSVLTVNNSSVNGNSAYQGGGIFSVLATMHVNNTQIRHNQALKSAGGGIFNDAGDVATVTASQIVSNSAVNDGGGLFNNTDATMTVTSGVIISNATGATGGGLSNYGSSLTISHTLIAYNQAEGVGGALAQAQGGSGTRVAQSCILGNSDVAVGADNSSPAKIDARNNFWGAFSGPSGVAAGAGDSVGASVNYTPFLQTPTSACPDVTPERGLWLPSVQAHEGESR